MSNIIIKNVGITNFRSHEKYYLDCNKNTTLILGENGCGKTSVLEAIYIALQGKSFRAVDKEIVKRESDFYRIEVDFLDGEKTVVTYERKNIRKNFLLKDKKYSRLPKKYKYPVVLFLPEDLHIVSTSPIKRRDFFDRFLVSLDDNYGNILSRYNQALKQRNELLKQENFSKELLFSWDILMAKYGTQIQKRRRELIEEINYKLTDIYRTIAENKDEVKIEYDSYTGDTDESGYLRLLQMDFERDRLTGHTNFGIHKDDYKFLFNNSLADGSASRGETRSIILALKFFEATKLYETLKKKPVVLLDDVFSELDKKRQKCLVKNFSNHQVILTSVDGVN